MAENKEVRYYTTISDGYGKLLHVGDIYGYATMRDVMEFANIYNGGYSDDSFMIWESRPKLKYVKKEGLFYYADTGEVWTRN